ncbi:MAG: histone-like nucleoid-structuring protein Lsr2, partial [Rhodococcus sp. (in: high G+C Gram-positive bacteria)]
STEIREWALGAGHKVSPRGRIPAAIVEAFHNAQAKPVQTKAAPAKKSAVKKAAVKKSAVKKPVAEAVPVTSAVVSKAPAKKSSTEIREWALGAGHKVSPRGRIPAEIVQAFHDAQARLSVA